MTSTHTTHWSYREGVHAFLLFIGLNITVILIELIIWNNGWEGIFTTSSDALNLALLYLVTLIVFVIPIIWLAKKKKFTIKHASKNTEPNIWHAFSCKKFSPIQAGKMLLLGYGLLFTAGILLTVLASVLPFEIPGLGPQQDLPFFEGDQSSKTVGAIIAVIFAPIIEEVFFRGMLLPTLLIRYSFTVSSLITAAIFAVLHLQPESVLGIFILSLILNYIYLKGGNSITNTIIFHMVNNTVAMLLIMNMDKIQALLPES